jgi:membrane-associated progesterone receptor component
MLEQFLNQSYLVYGIILFLIIIFIKLVFLSKPKKIPKKNESGIYTMEELSQFNGDNGSPIFVGIKGQIYDVTSKRESYGRGGSYFIFSGHEASRALAKSSLKEEDLSPFGVLDGLTEKEMKVLNDWEEYFKKRYEIIGKVKL